MLPARFVPDVDVVVVDEAGCWVKLGLARQVLAPLSAVVQARQVTVDWCNCGSSAVRTRRETRADVQSRASTVEFQTTICGPLVVQFR